MCVRMYDNYVCMRMHITEDVPLVEFMYFVFTRMPGESYRGRLESLPMCVTSFEC